MEKSFIFAQSKKGRMKIQPEDYPISKSSSGLLLIDLQILFPPDSSGKQVSIRVNSSDTLAPQPTRQLIELCLRDYRIYPEKPPKTLIPYPFIYARYIILAGFFVNKIYHKTIHGE